MPTPTPNGPSCQPGGRDASRRSTRYQLLDAARGVASLAVVLFHRPRPEGFWHPLEAVVSRGEVGVQIFFVISGYCIYASADRLAAASADRLAAVSAPARVFLSRRFWRIYVCYWASLALALLVSVWLTDADYGLRDIVGNMFIVQPYLHARQPVAAYWTLVVEQQFYLVIGVVLLKPFRAWRHELMLVSALVGGLYTLRVLPSNAWTNGTVVAHWLEFSLGILIFLVLHRPRLRLPAVLMLVFACACAFQGTYRTIAAGAFALGSLVLFGSDTRIAASRAYAPFRFLGMISYSLYLTHEVSFELVNRVFFGSSNPTLVSYLAGVTGAVALASVFYVPFEKPFVGGRPPRFLTRRAATDDASRAPRSPGSQDAGSGHSSKA